MNAIKGKIIELPPKTQYRPETLERDPALAAKEMRRMAREITIRRESEKVGAKVEQLVWTPEKRDLISESKFEDIDGGSEYAPKRVTISEFLNTPMNPPFVVRHLRSSRGNRKYLIETDEQLRIFIRWAVENEHLCDTDNVVCEPFVMCPSDSWASIGVMATWNPEDVMKPKGKFSPVAELHYGAPKDTRYENRNPSIYTKHPAQVGDPISMLGDSASRHFLGSRIFQSNLQYAGGTTLIDTGVKGSDDRYTRGERSRHVIEPGAVVGDVREELIQVGGVIILNCGPQDLTERERAIVEAHDGIDSETLELDRFYVEEAARIAAQRYVTGNRIHQLHGRFDFVGETLLEDNRRPSPYAWMVAHGSKSREHAERQKIKYAIRQ